MKKKILVLLLILTLCVSPVASADWNSFQGDIYHTAYQDDASDFVTNLWIFNMESPIIGSPAIFEDNLYVASQNGLLKCIDLEDGSEIWSLELDNTTLASPVIDNGTLYIGSTETFYAIDCENGKIIWQTDISGIEDAAFIYDGIVYVASGEHIYGLNNDTGEVELDANISGDVSSSLLIVNDTIYVGSDDTKLYALDLSGNVKWTYTTGNTIESTPAYGDGKIIFGSNDGNLYVLNESDGNLVFKVNLDNCVRSSATVDEYNNNIFVGSDAGNLTCIDLRDGTIKWSKNTGAAVQSTPAINGENVAFGSNNGVGYILNIYTGAEVFTYNPGTLLFNSPITSSPVIYGNTLIFTSQDGYVYSLNIDKHEVPTSIFLYYVLAILIVAIVVVTIIIRRSKGKGKKNKSKNERK